MASDPQQIVVVGAGAWGTALALAALRAGRRTTLWARRPEQAAELAQRRENPRYLPGVALPPALAVTADSGVLAAADAVILAVPTQRLRGVAAALAPVLPPVPLILAAKGIELESGLLLDQVLAETLPGRPLAVLSGPTFAAEVAAGRPAAATLACLDAGLGAQLVEALGSATFRPYWSDDVTGVLIGGAVKNVIAIACGIVAGRGLGENARAALITRGLAEVSRLGAALGARRETLTGLSGLGDLVLSCTTAQSRNYALGQALGAGSTLAAAEGASRGVSEGVATAAALVRLAAARAIEMPIAQAVDAVLHRGADIDVTVAGLLARPFKPETHWREETAMLFAFTCTDKANHGDVRLANREAHLAFLNGHLERIVFAGPFTSDDGKAMLGSLLVVEFDDRAAAEAFAAADPYAQAGLFAEVKITAVRKALPK